MGYLFVFIQAVHVAERLAAVLQLQHDGFALAVGATAGAAGHRQVVDGAEAVEAGVAAHLVDGAPKDHLVFALQRDGRRRRF